MINTSEEINVEDTKAIVETNTKDENAKVTTKDAEGWENNEICTNHAFICEKK